MWIPLLLAACGGSSEVSAPGPGDLAAAFRPSPAQTHLHAPLDAVRRRPSDPSAWGDLAVAMLRHKRATGAEIYDRYAEDAALAALAIDPGHLPAVHVQIRVTHGRHRFERAAELAEHARIRSPQDVTAMLLHGDALLEVGRYDEAHDAYQAALDQRPDLRSYNRGAHMRWMFGDLPGAITLMEDAVRAGGPGLAEPTAFCLAELAELQLRAGDPQRAIAAARAALELVDGYRHAQAVLGRAHGMLGDDAAAVEVVSQLVQEHPAVVDLLFLAELLDGHPTDPQAHDRAAALRARAEARQASDPRALAHHWARHAERSTEALAMAEQLAASRPTVDNLDTLALARLRSGKVADALDASVGAMRLGTADARLHLTRGLVAVGAGDLPEARRQLVRVEALNPLEDGLLMEELRSALRK